MSGVKTKTAGPVVIAAGGTGGHFFPAEALADALVARGHQVVLMTDARAGKRTTGVFATADQYVLPGAGVAGRGPVRALRGGLALLRGARQARAIMAKIRPAAVVGFGGYPSVPPLFGARMLPRGIRPAIVLHEGNAVFGKANAFLVRFANGVALSFSQVAGLPPGTLVRVTGMPVRPAIAALVGEGYEPPADSIRLLVWGGSLGARVFSDVVPEALSMLPLEIRERVQVTQQVRAEDLERVRTAYESYGIVARLEPFFSDVASLMREAHLVIGRAGGSSVAELCVAGRPSVLVPLPVAASDEQTANALAMQGAGAAWLIRQPSFTSDALSALLSMLFTDTGVLVAAAEAAAKMARPDAAERLADLVGDCVHGRGLHGAGPGAYARAGAGADQTASIFSFPSTDTSLPQEDRS
ncbi:undecaprenyldiphospho-muramoylpentapeptide beta-N-acetylglucosaminyltransferase [Acetobacter oeni]|uniref:UDP-N-acetylglucosamine--N-acetylmuramyl-(pentapeptide) pyrophosphoryl-undecaprenol N-acetylglucosamine transferase n=1 Tax=Acetobacter oeni TaxID=304077 RepID=A0A511XHW8_9PROT|nr:undecaprenyldiphospho-muramoylpentapeptide beta-N-acetylglucosaminyltransferase [Acetobacter oeni]MBB3882517.1 UDP-N-acetylglucosamine--N-acetylmuramyl-(pentapeptide) pyrophosphoryl-undecaprenol N-acetylglucosamine transferase [Acetobacter oeni]GBR11835.1 undecaprenyldiphospho-muramoylpentapeptide beta-N- acetylglucosaminyltransferase [Acetobacter oeni LMG 21952]GEN62546.1 UDP-N-acetylglucosamine--N-acetylmuramyl-(pentapeptide) pyrophosphoryl-undecaprenol N-acetylglucosamine transferase [Acet